MQQMIVEEKKKSLLERREELIQRLNRIDKALETLKKEKYLILSEITKLNTVLKDYEGKKELLGGGL